MSDLQCPARLLLARPRELPHDDAEARTLALRLAGQLAAARVAMVYDDGGADPTVAATVAGTLGVPLARSTDLESVVDLHRGEAVLVLCQDDDLLSAVRPLLLPGRPADPEDPSGRDLPVDGSLGWLVLEIAADADGWRLRRADR